jgi:hypothetical protein
LYPRVRARRFTVAKLCLPAVDAWAEGREMLVGGAVVLGVLTAFGVGMTAARRNVVVPTGR